MHHAPSLSCFLCYVYHTSSFFNYFYLLVKYGLQLKGYVLSYKVGILCRYAMHIHLTIMHMSSECLKVIYCLHVFFTGVLFTPNIITNLDACNLLIFHYCNECLVKWHHILTV